MKTASIQELKAELSEINAAQLRLLCLRLAKYKKENKELLGYLLFDAHDESAFTEEVKANIKEEFADLPKANTYLTKKSLRKILRIANKHIKHIATKQADASIRIYFCQLMKASGIPFEKTTVLKNLYLQQLKNISTAIATLHEDLQYDYQKELDQLKIK